jgi:hypothetical protein
MTAGADRPATKRRPVAPCPVCSAPGPAGLPVLPAGQLREEYGWATPGVGVWQLLHRQEPPDGKTLVRRTVHVGPWEPVEEADRVPE